jgi:voltage-gated potassium channel Kch
VILGWSPQVFNIISELVIANESQPQSCVVILGDRDKVEMEDEIRDKVGSTGRTRIVCRTGSPMDMNDLDLVSLQTSKSIVVLAPEDDDPDASVIKTLLAITLGADPSHIISWQRFTTPRTWLSPA